MHFLRLILLRLVGAVLRLARRAPTAAPRRVLVIKPDNLGDLLLLTPALRLLRAQLPQAEIALMIGPWSTPAVAHNPDVDTVLLCPFPGFDRERHGGLLGPYRLLLRMALLLRAGRFDTALIARDDHWWGALMAALAGVPRIVGYAVPEVAPFLSDPLPHSYGDHVTAQAIALVEALTGAPAIERPTLRAPYGAHERAWAQTWLARNRLDDGRPVFAVHPGAGGGAKLWLCERWVTVADALQNAGHVVLTGGPQERDLVAAIGARMRQPPLLLAGEATLGQLAALYASCALVLGVDSGPLHLAVAADVSTVALFGPGDDRRFGPWGDGARNRVIRSGLWCSPCGVLDACPRGTAPSECMAHIAVKDVLDAAGI